MSIEREADAGDLGPLSQLPPGSLLGIGSGALSLDIAPEAGGRIAQIRCDGIEQLLGHGEHGATTAISWGCYPMLPWCGRIRHGRFAFDGRSYALPVNLGPHAIHGVGYMMPWQVVEQGAEHVAMALQLPRDRRWPFGGSARQRIEVRGRSLHLAVSVTATTEPMPVAMGWHPWFRKPERLEFAPEAQYPRDAEGMAVMPTVPVRGGPWDDCFINRREVRLQRGGQRLTISSDCVHWVVYDEPAYATCVEPQTGPADSFNLDPGLRLERGETATAECVLRWD